MIFGSTFNPSVNMVRYVPFILMFPFKYSFYTFLSIKFLFCFSTSFTLTFELWLPTIVFNLIALKPRSYKNVCNLFFMVFGKDIFFYKGSWELKKNFWIGNFNFVHVICCLVEIFGKKYKVLKNGGISLLASHLGC